MNEVIHAGITFGEGKIIITYGYVAPDYRDMAEKAMLFQVAKTPLEPGSPIPDGVELAGEQGIQFSFKNNAAIDRLIADLTDLRDMAEGDS